MLACHSCGFRNLPQAIFCGGCGQLLEGIVCPVCNAANPKVNRFCNQCGQVIRNSVAASVIAPPPHASVDLPSNSAAGVLPRTESAVSPFGLLSKVPATINPGAAITFVTTVLAERSTPLLISGAAAVVLAQLGLTFSVGLNEKALMGYLLLLGLGAGVSDFGEMRGVYARAGASHRRHSR